jgi:hypothetical protein
MNRGRCNPFTIGALAVLLLTLTVTESRGADLSELLNSSGNSKVASGIVRELQEDPNLGLIEVLTAMRQASATQKNWLISLAQVIADRDSQKSKQQLVDFLKRDSQDSVARYWAYNFVTRGNETAREEFLAGAIEDPSLDIRYEAIELALAELQGDPSRSVAEKKTQLKDLLSKARLAEQIQKIGGKLEELGEPQDLLKHFGFIANWKLLGPFDNVDRVGFSAEYAPESALRSGTIAENFDLLEGVDGKSGKLSWKEVSTDEQDGTIDIAAALGKEKGAVAYLVADFPAAQSMKCQLRIGTPNATKIWLNGDLIMNREVYHAGNQVDQYVESVELKKGRNEIMIKSCQNEQTDSWAQDWTFQVRFTDETGKAIQPAK